MELVIFLAGLLIGVVAMLIALNKLIVGNLRIASADPNEPPYLFLEVSKGVDDIFKKKYVVLKVNPKDISRK